MTDVDIVSDDLQRRVRDEVARILDGGLSGSSERQKALLDYLVSEELEGRGPRLKAYAIATEVFGRSGDFDPQTDSIVRVEVGRLRQALERHYLTAGLGSDLVLSIPKGAYRPQFAPRDTAPPVVAADQAPVPPPPPEDRSARRLAWTRRTIAAAVAAFLGAGLATYFTMSRPAPAPAPAARAAPLIAVAPFAFSADRPGQEFVAAGLHAEIAGALSEFDWLSVAPLLQDVRFDAERSWNVDFLLRATLRQTGERVAATVLLLDGESRSVRWSKTYDFALKPGEVGALENDIVGRIAADVGHPFGIVADLERARLRAAAVETDAAFACKLHAMQYWSARRRTDYPAARSCFEALATKDARDADSLAALALLQLDAVVEGFDAGPRADLLQRARDLAARAQDLDRTRSLPQMARYSAALCAGDLRDFESAGRAFAAAHPANPVALADIGLKLALSQVDPAGGAALLERAKALSHDLLPASATALAAERLRKGETPDMAALETLAFRTDSVWVLLNYLAAAKAAGDEKSIARAEARLAETGFDTRQKRSDVLEAQCWAKEVKEAVGRGM